MMGAFDAPLRPQTEAEVAEMVRSATGPLSLRGGGTRGVAYGVGQGLEMAGLSGITLYEPGALTLVAGAGTPLAEVQAATRTGRQPGRQMFSASRSGSGNRRSPSLETPNSVPSSAARPLAGWAALLDELVKKALRVLMP